MCRAGGGLVKGREEGEDLLWMGERDNEED